MAKIAVMTQLSPTMKEGVFVEWLKNEGDSVRPGDTLASIETDKAVMELEAFDSGVLLKKIAQKGDKIPVGAPIGILGNAGENIDTLLADLKTSTPKPAALPPLPPSTKADLSSGTEKLSTLNHNNTGSSQSNLVNETPPFPPHGRIVASPLAKKRAAQEGIDLTRIQGTGP
ncbi:MAG TPA: E3 binding domain-containing protein, partial [Turneriella sp.]|nr:E3 binding domain-containing protein [Turneriella sp.]